MSEVQLESRIRCPRCGHEAEELMPEDACQFFYECRGCRAVLRPKHGHCCVFCSFGTVRCPVEQRRTGDTGEGAG